MIYPTNFVANVNSGKYMNKAKYEEKLQPSDENFFVCHEKQRVNFLLISFLKGIIKETLKDDQKIDLKVLTVDSDG